MARQITNHDAENKPTVKKSKGSRGASKKAYAVNGAMTLARNKARRAKRVERRKTYWKSPKGMARKFEKMNTPAKLAKMKAWREARAERRRAKPVEEKTA